MNAQKSLEAFTDAAADAVARAIAGVQRDALREREVRDAEHRARLAELDALVAQVRGMERDIADRLATVKDGEAGPAGRDGVDGRDGADGVSGQDGSVGPEGQPGADGERGLPGESGEAGPGPSDEMIDAAVARYLQVNPVAAGPAGERGLCGEKGEQGEPGETGSSGADGIAGRDGLDGAVGPRGEAGPMGALPVVKAWVDRVHYEGEVTLQDGATYQAVRDTGRQPPHEDWNCIARAGNDGRDGRTFRICGTYADGADHLALDVVVLNGASFVAKHDAPGECPGEGWQMIAAQGKRGQTGERGVAGPKGERGMPGSSVLSMDADGEGLVTVTNADGSTVTCDLYPVLSQLAR